MWVHPCYSPWHGAINPIWVNLFGLFYTNSISTVYVECVGIKLPGTENRVMYVGAPLLFPFPNQLAEVKVFELMVPSCVVVQIHL